MRWERLLKEGITLEAPNTTRYRHFFEGVRAGDLVLHYLTTALTPKKEKRSSVVGASRVAADPAAVGKKIVAGCSDTLELSKPVLYNELHGRKRKSPLLSKLGRLNMQRYLTQISQPDFESILGVHPKNKCRFLKSPLAKHLRTCLNRHGVFS